MIVVHFRTPPAAAVALDTRVITRGKVWPTSGDHGSVQMRTTTVVHLRWRDVPHLPRRAVVFAVKIVLLFFFFSSASWVIMQSQRVYYRIKCGRNEKKDDKTARKAVEGEQSRAESLEIACGTRTTEERNSRETFPSRPRGRRGQNVFTKTVERDARKAYKTRFRWKGEKKILETLDLHLCFNGNSIIVRKPNIKK